MIHTKKLASLRKRGRAAALATVALLLGMMMAACGSDDDDPPPPPGGGKKVISGTVTPQSSSANQSNSVTATAKKFQAEVSGPARRVRAAGAVSHAVSGRLQDGKIIYELEGEYDPESRAFSVQAPSDLIIFSLKGKLKDDGALEQAKAVIQVKNNADWITIECDVGNGDGSPVTDAVTVTEKGKGMPETLWGKWRDALSPDTFLVSRNGILMDSSVYGLYQLDVVEVEESSGAWDILVRSQFTDDQTYTERYNLAKTLQQSLQNKTVDSIVQEPDDSLKGKTLQQAVAALPAESNRLFVAPYVSTQGVYHDNTGNYAWLSPQSPLFNSTSDAKAATSLEALSGFTFLLEK